jgi:hypothetical protein
MWRDRRHGIVAAMPTTTPLTTASAAALREQLHLLERERATATLAGVAANERYMADLLDEIEASRAAYVGAAVTEIASLRAELDGALFG